MHDVQKVDFAIVEGFRQGFSKNFRKAFDFRYYDQLGEDIFEYKCITPRKFIEHLKNKWVKLDTMVVKHLRGKYFRGWDTAEDEHVVSFRVRLDRDQKTCGKYTPPVTITTKEKN